MQRSSPLLRTFLHAPHHRAGHRSFTQLPRLQTGGGTGPSEHITNSTDGLDVHTNAAKSGKADRASGGEGSTAANEKDVRGSNKRAQKDLPEAPSVVIGMNDERGSKGH